MKIYYTERRIRRALRNWLVETSHIIISKDDVLRSFVDLAKRIRGLNFNNLMELLKDERDVLQPPLAIYYSGSGCSFSPSDICRIIRDDFQSGYTIMDVIDEEDYKAEVRMNFINKCTDDEKERFLQFLSMFDEEDETEYVASFLREKNQKVDKV